MSTPDDHADRTALVDALPDERPVGVLRHDLVRWRRWSPPGDRWRHVHERPGSTSVTSHTSFGRRGCLISKRLPTSMPGPSSATIRSTDAVHSGQRSTSAKTSHTIGAGASISTLLSVIMYQMVHQSGTPGKIGQGHGPLVRAGIGQAVHRRMSPPWPSIAEPGMTRSRHGSSRSAAKAGEVGPSDQAGTMAGS